MAYSNVIKPTRFNCMTQAVQYYSHYIQLDILFPQTLVQSLLVKLEGNKGRFQSQKITPTYKMQNPSSTLVLNLK